MSSFNNMNPMIVSQPLPTKPPVKPRTAFICFKDSKLPQITWTTDTDEILKYISKEWQKLNKADRAHWDEVSRDDKVRYGRENEAYKGPVAVPKRRAKKDPLAPRRPMSAFLKFSQDCRKKIKEENPHLENTDISQLLGAIWKSAPKSQKTPYVEQEKVERAAYKERMRIYKAKKAQEEATSRVSAQEVQASAPHVNSFEPYHRQNPHIFRPHSGSHHVDQEGGYRQKCAQPVYARHKVAPETFIFPEPYRPPSPHAGYPTIMPENYRIKENSSELSQSDMLLAADEVSAALPHFDSETVQRKRPEASCHFESDDYYRF